MSLFQCERCGSLENSVHGNYHAAYMWNSDLKKAVSPALMKDNFIKQNTVDALMSYKQILGLKPEEPFGKYCSACDPSWFTEKGEYGVGPNPNPKPDEGLWHGDWDRMFLPKGQFETAPNGNLRHKITKSENVGQYALTKEEGT